MTRAEQNIIIVEKIERQLDDQPNVQYRIIESFTAWFNQLVEQGLQMLAPPAAAPAGGGGAPNQGQGGGGAPA